MFCSFAGYPVFLVYTLFKPKYHSAGTGSMLRGVQRYDNDPDFLVYTLFKTKQLSAGAGSMLRGVQGMTMTPIFLYILY